MQEQDIATSAPEETPIEAPFAASPSADPNQPVELTITDEEQTWEFDLENLKVSKNSLFYGLIKLQKFNYEINSNKENINNIDEIIEFTKPTSTWKYLAHELLASYYIKKKDFDNALQSLDAIINSNESSEFVKERAKTIFEMLKQKK